jgi:hypothetical protein
MALARRHLKIEVTDDLETAESLAQLFDLERAHYRFPINVLM